jgi:hypothetical protein
MQTLERVGRDAKEWVGMQILERVDRDAEIGYLVLLMVV